MNSTSTIRLAIAGGLALILAFIGGMAVYGAVADHDMMGGMWDHMDDMGGMVGGRSHGNETTGTASGQGQVRIVDFDYVPSVLEVTPGTVVKWTNEDSAPHTATTNDGSFDTGRLDKDESGEITLQTPGSFDYICTYHPYMKGRIVVSPSSTANR